MSVEQFRSLRGYLNDIKIQHQTKGPPTPRETWPYIQNEILSEHPPLRSYLKNLPKLFNGVSQRPIQTYETYARDYKPPGFNTPTSSNSP